MHIMIMVRCECICELTYFFCSSTNKADDDKNAVNIFSNDGSFMNQFKALLEKQKKEKEKENQKEKQKEKEKEKPKGKDLKGKEDSTQNQNTYKGGKKNRDYNDGARDTDSHYHNSRNNERDSSDYGRRRSEGSRYEGYFTV